MVVPAEIEPSPVKVHSDEDAFARRKQYLKASAARLAAPQLPEPSATPLKEEAPTSEGSAERDPEPCVTPEDEVSEKAHEEPEEPAADVDEEHSLPALADSDPPAGESEEKEEPHILDVGSLEIELEA